MVDEGAPDVKDDEGTAGKVARGAGCDLRIPISTPSISACLTEKRSIWDSEFCLTILSSVGITKSDIIQSCYAS